MKKTYENVWVTCMHGNCCAEEGYVTHPLICPVCENVIWIVAEEIIDKQPIEEWSTPELKCEGTLAMRTIECICPDCDYVYRTGSKCLICGNGYSCYYTSDYVFSKDEFDEMVKAHKNKLSISREVYIKQFREKMKKKDFMEFVKIVRESVLSSTDIHENINLLDIKHGGQDFSSNEFLNVLNSYSANDNPEFEGKTFKIYDMDEFIKVFMDCLLSATIFAKEKRIKSLLQMPFATFETKNANYGKQRGLLELANTIAEKKYGYNIFNIA